MAKIRIRNIDLPVVFNASGTRGFFGDGKEYWFHRFFRLIGLVWLWSVFVAKTTTLKARKGNMPLKQDGYSPLGTAPDCIHLGQAWRGRLLNAVGLSGPGLEALLATKKWQKRQKPFFISFMTVGETKWQRELEFRTFVARLAKAAPDFASPFGVQLNISCPNTGHAMISLADEVRMMLNILAHEHRLDGVPLLVKGNVLLPIMIAQELEKHPRLDGWVMSNTIHWNDLAELSIDAQRIFGSSASPLEKFGGGGYSGPEMRRHVKMWICKARESGMTKVIIAENGIRAPWHAIEMIDAGADAIGIGSMAICRPFYVLPTILAAHWAAKKRQRRMAESRIERLTMRRPDDFHVHLRDGNMLRLVLPATTLHFGRFLVMPNKPAIRTAEDMDAYRDKITKLTGPHGPTPLMTVMLGPKTTVVDVMEAADAGALAFKLYPDGVTTGSEGGVRNIRALWPIFKVISEMRTMPLPDAPRTKLALCLHGEMPGVYCIKREIAFLDVLESILRDFPKLPVVLEHITTKEAVEFVRSRARMGHKIAATITAHHLLRTLDDIIGSKVRVHEHCQPCPKGPDDREALIEAATGGESCFFFGSDTAPHDYTTKQCAEGCAGVYSAPAALATLAEIFEARGKLERLEHFVSRFGAEFYGLPLNNGTITLAKKPQKVPPRYDRRSLCVVPWRAGETITWQVEPTT